MIADFREEFDNAFDGFVKNDLPRDEVFYQIQAEIQKKQDQQQARAEKSENPLGNKRVLPEVLEPTDRISRKLDIRHRDELLALMDKDEKKLEELYGPQPRPSESRGKFGLVENLNKSKQYFE